MNPDKSSVLPRVLPYAGGGGMAIMLSSTSPVPTPDCASAAAYVGSGGRFHGARPIAISCCARRALGRISPGCTYAYRSARRRKMERSMKMPSARDTMANATWTKICADVLLNTVVVCGSFCWSSELDAGDCIRLIMSTQAATVPPRRHSWKIVTARVVRRKPAKVGIRFGLRNEMRLRLPAEFAVFVDSARDGERGGSAPATAAAAAPSPAAAAGGASRSAGCRSGRLRDEELAWLPASGTSSAPSRKPISPRFLGKGPACGRGGSSYTNGTSCSSSTCSSPSECARTGVMVTVGVLEGSASGWSRVVALSCETALDAIA